LAASLEIGKFIMDWSKESSFDSSRNGHSTGSPARETIDDNLTSPLAALQTNYRLTAESSAMEVLYLHRSLRQFKQRDLIPLPDSDIWLVVRGVVALETVNANGEESLVGLVGPDIPFGKPLSSLRFYEARALTPVDLLPLPLSEIERSAPLAQQLCLMLVQRQRQTESLLAVVGHRQIEERLKEFLEMLGQAQGEGIAEGRRLHMYLTHQQIANALSTTRPTISRLLGDLRRQGWLSVDDQSRWIVPKSSGANPDLAASMTPTSAELLS
jgi:CRP-like cAMP-binding protein